MAEICGEIDVGQFLGTVEQLVDKAHGVDTVHALLEGLLGFLVGGAGGLEPQQRGYDLEVVLHPVVNLLEQRFELGIGGGELARAFLDPLFQRLLRQTVLPGCRTAMVESGQSAIPAAPATTQ